MSTHTPTHLNKIKRMEKEKEIEPVVVAYPIHLVSETPLGEGYPHAETPPGEGYPHAQVQVF